MREPRPAPDTLNDPDDAWSRAWGSPALQDLGRYLTATGTPGEHAALLVEQVWIFYSYEVLPALQQQTPLVIAVKGSPARPRIQITLLINVADEPDVTARDDRTAELQGAFHRKFSEPLASIAEFSLEVTMVTGIHTLRVPVSMRQLNRVRQQVLESGNWDFAVVYVDDLASEFATIMDADDIATWLDTRNLMFGGLSPRELLGTPDEHLLRDVVTRAKFNLPAA